MTAAVIITHYFFLGTCLSLKALPNSLLNLPLNQFFHVPVTFTTFPLPHKFVKYQNSVTFSFSLYNGTGILKGFKGTVW